MPYTILRSTQFFEFARGLIGWNTDAEGTVRLPSTSMQPVAVEDVVTALSGIATSICMRRLVEIAGPEVFTLDGQLVGSPDRTEPDIPQALR